MRRRSFLWLLGLGSFSAACLSSLIQLEENPSWALSGRQIKTIAQNITVQVEGAGSSGSGVILFRRESQYFVLTAKHVLAETQPGEEASIRTHDGDSHPLQTESILSMSGMDIALVSFESDRNYSVATVGDSDDLAETDTVYVSGFPLTGQAITQPTFTITKGVISGLGQYERGYGLVYDSVTQVGMSGGPILNSTGQLVGIHGLAEGERLQGVPVKAGLNLGIPVQVILAQTPLPIRVVETIPPSSPSENSAAPSQQNFRRYLDQYYAALPKLIEARDAQRLFDFMPIDKERFRYTTRTGEIQTFTSRLVGATKYFQKSKARKERWSITFDDISIEMLSLTTARVTHVETVKWSVWPGLARGVAKRREIYIWDYINGIWGISLGQEEKL